MLPPLVVPRTQVFLRRCCWRSRLCQLFLLVLNLLLIDMLVSQLYLWTSVSNPVSIDEATEHPLQVPPRKIERYKLLRKQFGYNAWLVEQLPLRQPVRDVRDKRCDRSEPPAALTAASIVVIFRNEQLAMLLRTLHSIKDATPPELINGMFLINDHSDMGFWQQKLSRDAFDEYVRQTIFREVRILHLEESIGVVRARRLAINMAIATKVVFLDAHVQLTAGWLPPLLLALKDNKKTLATPQLDELDEDTLQYKRVEPRRGLFDWTLRRREVPLLKEQLQQLPRPYETPVMRAAVFAVNVKVFQNLVEFDGQLNAPAAAELALSLEYWCSGGRVLVVPCSRVAHLQPSDTHVLQRYSDMNQMGLQLLRVSALFLYFRVFSLLASASSLQSYKRLAKIWLNDPLYQLKVYEVQPQIKNSNIGSMKELYERFQKYEFKSFDWYLQHVATDLLQHFPLEPAPETDLDLGAFQPAQLPKHCLTGSRETGIIRIMPCSGNANQKWYLSPTGDIRDNDYYCLELQPGSGKVGLNLCHNLGGYQSWHYDRNSMWLVSYSDCLEYDQLHDKITMERCNRANLSQKWNFSEIIKNDLNTNQTQEGGESYSENSDN